MKSDYAKVSMSSVIFNVPLRPAYKSSRDFLIVKISVFIFSHSYKQTTTNGDLSLALEKRSIITYKGGSYAKNLVKISLATISLFYEPPPPDPPEHERIVENNVSPKVVR